MESTVLITRYRPKRTTSFPGMSSSCPSLLAHLLTSVLTDLPVTRINSLAIEVLKGHKAEHLMTPDQASKVTTVKSESANFHLKETYRSMGSFSSFPPHPPGPWAVARRNPTDVIRSTSIWDRVNLVRLGPPIFTSPLSGPVQGSSSVWLGKDERGELWRPLDISYSESRKWSGWAFPVRKRTTDTLTRRVLG